MPVSPKKFDTAKMRLALWGYAILWALCLPLIIGYLFFRGRKDKIYSKFLPERFGRYSNQTTASVWVHAVSLGEMRSAGPLIRKLLDAGETVITTHFTPAGRRAAKDLFPQDIDQGRLIAVYVPFEFDWVFKKFFLAFKPKYGLVMEIEIWPRMIASSRKHGIPLFTCNAQYPEHSFKRDRDKTSLRGALVSGFAGHMVKSQTQAERFAALGAENIAITGELRFDQPIPQQHLQAAGLVTTDKRPVVTIASVVEGEDEQYLAAYELLQQRAQKEGKPKPLFIHVPRAPERFQAVGQMLTDQGQLVQRRSGIFDENLAQIHPLTGDILLGDSMGEMYFYLALSNAAIVGGGFVPKGAHNVIEALALHKPVFVGPHIWTIEYPATEAIAAGVLHKCDKIEALVDTIYSYLYDADVQNDFATQAAQFMNDHSGAAQKTLDALPALLAKAGK